jgi:DNA-binding transcriptional LysR family regulator
MQNGLYASPAYLARYGSPEKPSDLLGHVCLGMISGTGEALPWRLSRGAEQWEGRPDGPLAANSRSLQRDLAAHGLGIVGLADRFAGQWVEQGLLKRVLPDWLLPTVTIWCVTPGRRLLPVRTTAFMEMLRTALGN